MGSFDMDEIKAHADFVTDDGDSCFHGNGDVTVFFHNEELSPGAIWINKTGSLACKIIRRIEVEDAIRQYSNPELFRKNLDLSLTFAYLAKMD